MDINEEKLALIKKILSVSDTKIIEQLKNVLEMNDKRAGTGDDIFTSEGRRDELTSGNSMHYAEFMKKYQDIIKKKS